MRAVLAFVIGSLVAVTMMALIAKGEEPPPIQIEEPPPIQWPVETDWAGRVIHYPFRQPTQAERRSRALFAPFYRAPQRCVE